MLEIFLEKPVGQTVGEENGPRFRQRVDEDRGQPLPLQKLFATNDVPGRRPAQQLPGKDFYHGKTPLMGGTASGRSRKAHGAVVIDAMKKDVSVSKRFVWNIVTAGPKTPFRFSCRNG